MVAKKEFYKKKLHEQRIKILKAIIEEEIETFLVEQDDGGDPGGYDFGSAGGGGAHYSGDWGFGGGGGGGDNKSPWGRGTFLGTFGGQDLRNLVTVAGAGAGKLLTQAASGIKKIVLGGISALLPFNDPRATKRLLDGITNWEQAQVRAIDSYFAKGMAEIEEDWSKFKDDFWGIGFVASPAGAIAAAITADKGIDAALSVGNVLSGGRLGAAIEDLTPGANSHMHEVAESGISKGDVSKAYEEAMSGKIKQESNSFGEALKKFEAAGGSMETLKQLGLLLVKDEKVIKAGEQMMASQLESAIDTVVKDLINAINKKEISTDPQQVQELKSNLENYLAKIVIDSAKKKGIVIEEDELKKNPAFVKGFQKASQEVAVIKLPAQPQQAVRQAAPQSRSQRTAAQNNPAVQPGVAPAPTNKQ